MFTLKVQNFVLRLAACFRERKDQLVFLINNYDMMLSVIMVSFIIIFFFAIYFSELFSLTVFVFNFS